MAAAVRYAQNLDPGRVVVVVLPDSGSRYFTRVCDDKWMRENGFLEINWGEVSSRNCWKQKTRPGLICAPLDTPMVELIEKMKKYDISQVSALNADGTLG